MILSWKRARELSSITKNGQTDSYRYNKDGLRTNKYLADGTVSYQYDGNLLVGEQKKDSNGNFVYELEFIYDSTESVIALLYNGTEYYYEKNLQGDIVGILNSQGERIVTYQYDSWGKLIDSTGDSQLKDINPLRYRGYYYDSETGWYYLNSRYYDAEVGRFISADTLISTGQGFLGYNMYIYCLNNPINYVDFSGHDAVSIQMIQQWWSSVMWWLCAVDAVLPVGDAVYFGVIITLTIISIPIQEPVVIPEISKGTSQNKVKSSVYSFDDNSDDDYDDEYDDDYYRGGRKKMSGGKGKTPGDNRRQNRDFKRATRGLDKDTKRRIHNDISKKGYSYHDIVDFVESFFDNLL